MVKNRTSRLFAVVLVVVCATSCLVASYLTGYEKRRRSDEDRLRRLAAQQNETIASLVQQQQRRHHEFEAEREWSPVALRKDEWIVYLRIQKTGSQTLWLTLIEATDGSVWTKRKCVRGPFCGYRCSRVLAAAFESFVNENKFRLLVRAHANLYDYVTAADMAGVDRNRIHFLAFLREPISRARSEHEHVTRGLVAQFGPKAFGRAWDYNFTDRTRSSLSDWIECEPCRVGSSNRQTRFLAGLATTGSPQEHVGEEDLRAALIHLKQCTFVGILDRFSDSMLLLRETFPTHLARFTSYSLSLHPKLKSDAVRRQDGEAETALLADLNRLDSALYQAATEIFERRFASMLASLPEDRRSMRFKSPLKTTRRGGSTRRRFILSH